MSSVDKGEEEESVVAIMTSDEKAHLYSKPMPLHRENQKPFMV